MKKILILCIAALCLQMAAEARDYVKLHEKEMKHAQKYSAKNKYFGDYASLVETKVSPDLKDPKLIKLGRYDDISKDKLKEKFAKDKEEYAKIAKSLSAKKVDNYNNEPYASDFYRIYRIVERIVRANNLDYINWRIVIADDTAINAYSSQLNCLTFNTGLIDTFSNNENALALIVGHEIAHSQAGHSIRLSKLRTKIDRAARNDAPLAYAALKRKYIIESKNAEFAADVEGAKYAAKAGYDLSSAKEVLLTLNAMDDGYDLFDTHPAPEKRLQNYNDNRKYFMEEEWAKQGLYNIYNSNVLKCEKSSDRKTLILSRGKMRSADSYGGVEPMEEVYLRMGYKSYLAEEFDKSIEYFKKYLNLDRSNYAVYLYISYDYEQLYKKSNQEKYLKLANEFAGYAQRLAPDNKYVKEQIESL